jgi:hypothetical protein
VLSKDYGPADDFAGRWVVQAHESLRVYRSTTMAIRSKTRELKTGRSKSTKNASRAQSSGLINVSQRQDGRGSVRSKLDQVTSLLSSSDGATIADLMRCTGWQAHSVRGFLSGTIRKRKGLLLLKVRDEQGVLRYRIHSNGSATP